jgi:hypothetical protein
MERFLKRHEGRIKGIISGLDRILFRGTIRNINYRQGIEKWLWSQGVPLTNFRAFADEVSEKIRNHAHAIAEKKNRPYQHIESPKASKEEIARRIMQEDKIEKGLVCVLGCVEPCRSFKIKKDRKKKILGLVPRQRQCLHIYFYYVDREFGLMHVRLQTWLPFTIQVCLNGWEWLAYRLDREGIQYEKRDNCFAHIDDLAQAQKLMDSLIVRKWHSWFNGLAKAVNPWLDAKNGLSLCSYYWTLAESEYATDVIFKDSATLKLIYPSLVQHAIHQFSAQNVLRFLQRRIQSRFKGEIKSELRVRVEGVRIKHWVEENSIKMYDKQGCVLRIETTINNPRRWTIRRRATRKGKTILAWFPMRKGLADIRRRVEVSRAANERYLEALSVVGETLPAKTLLDPVSKRLICDGRSYRRLNPIAPDDASLLQAIAQGEFLLHGIRNKNLRKALYHKLDNNPEACQRTSAKISRILRLLRAHGLIRKVSRTHTYRLTQTGHRLISAALNVREINVLQLAA